MELRLAIGNLWWRKLYRPVLFNQDPEDAHDAVIRGVRNIQEHSHLLGLARWLYRSPLWNHPLLVCGQEWTNFVGIGPGIDKNGEQIPFWNAIGAGCLEIGGVTPLPQHGRTKPRLFRYQHTIGNEETYILVNRMGYPSYGAATVAGRLTDTFRRHKITMPIIVQLAPNTTTIEGYEKSRNLNLVLKDYIAVARVFLPVLRPGKDFLSVGISPNTPGLRELFVHHPEEFAQGLRKGLDELAMGRPLPPLIYKMPPFIDLGISEKEFETLVQVIGLYGNGIAATNTVTDEIAKARQDVSEAGGMSGDPLRLYARKTQFMIQEVTQEKKLPIDLIAIGGIMNPKEVKIVMTHMRCAAMQIVSWLTRDGPIVIHRSLEAVYR